MRDFFDNYLVLKLNFIQEMLVKNVGSADKHLSKFGSLFRVVDK